MRIVPTDRDGIHRVRTANSHCRKPDSVIERLIDRYELSRSVCAGYLTNNNSRLYNDLGSRAKCSRERIELIRQLRRLGIRNVPPGPAHSIRADFYCQLHGIATRPPRQGEMT